MKKLVIFDLDGTLLNTIEDLANAANFALVSLGFPKRDLAECQSFVGNGVTKLLERALPNGSKTEENLNKMREVFSQYYDKHLWQKTFFYKGIDELLQELFQNHILLAVASNKYQSATERLIKHFFKNIPFISVLGQREGVPVKPNPQIVKEILKIATLSEQEALYVGDSDVDMQTALNAQVDSCAVTWGFREIALLTKYNPKHVVDNPSQILKLI